MLQHLKLQLFFQSACRRLHTVLNGSAVILSLFYKTMLAAEPVYNVTTEGMPDSTNNNAVHSLTEMISNVSQLLFLFVPIGINRYYDDATEMDCAFHNIRLLCH